MLSITAVRNCDSKGELNQQAVKLAYFEDEFGWHFHENEDELFLVVAGAIEILLEDSQVLLTAGEFLIVPKGIKHNPRATQKSLVMLLEPMTTLNTGNIKNDKTVEVLEKI